MPCAPLLSAACPAKTRRAQHHSPVCTHIAYPCVCVLRHGTRVAQVPCPASRSLRGCVSTRGLTWAPVGSAGHPPASACSHAQPCTRANTEVCTNTWGHAYVCVPCARVCAHTREFWAVGCTHVCAQRMGPHWERVWVGSTRVGWHVLCPGTTRWCPASVSPFGDIKLHPAQGHGGGS